MSGPLKNSRHETMAQEMAKGTDQTEAHRLAGGTGKRAAACMIARRPDVRARVAEILARAAAKTEITVADIAHQLDEDRAFAKKMEAPAAMVSATMGKAKVLGLIIEKTKTEITNPDGSLRPTVIRIVAADDRSADQAST